MELLLTALKNLPEFRQILEGMEAGKAVAATGLSQLNRSHVIAALCHLSGRPVAVICQDDLAAKRLQSELQAFLGVEAPGAARSGF